MSLIIDNLLFIFDSVLKIGEKEEFAKVVDIKLEKDLVTVIIPARREKYSAILQTVKSINKQTVDSKILIVVNSDDLPTLKEAKKLESDFSNVKVITVHAKSKAQAINEVLYFIDSKYILLIDVGDIFFNENAIESLLKVAEYYNCYAVLSVLEAFPRDSLWKKFVHLELKFWSFEVIRAIKKKFGFVPLSGTGLLIKTSVLRRVKFPDTLAEDATLGYKIRNVRFTDQSIVLYNLPRRLRDHLRQRARWIAGYLQSLKVAKGKDKIVYFVCSSVQGMVTISFIFFIISMFVKFYSFPFTLIDILAGINLLFILLGYLKKSKLSILMPFWWIISGISFFIGIYYLLKRKWYFSPKDVIKLD